MLSWDVGKYIIWKFYSPKNIHSIWNYSYQTQFSSPCPCSKSDSYSLKSLYANTKIQTVWLMYVYDLCRLSLNFHLIYGYFVINDTTKLGYLPAPSTLCFTVQNVYVLFIWNFVTSFLKKKFTMQERSNRLPSHIHPISTPRPTPNIYGCRLVLNLYWKMDRKDVFPPFVYFNGDFSCISLFSFFLFLGMGGGGGM